jgi:hypothetical protein
MRRLREVEEVQRRRRFNGDKTGSGRISPMVVG